MAETTPEVGPNRPQKSEKTNGAPIIVKAGDTPPGDTPSGDTPPGDTSPGGNGLIWAAVIISLAALAAGGYAWQSAVNVRVESARQVDRVNALERRFGTLSSAQQEVRDEVGRITGQLGGAEDSVAGRIDELRDETLVQQAAATAREEQLRREVRVLSDSVAEFRSEFGRSIDQWRLREVEQLMVIANQRLQLSADTEMAGTALKLADSHLRRLSDPALRPVRVILAHEIVSLGNVATVDVAGTLNALSALARAVDELPLAGEIMGRGVDSGGASPPADQADDDSSWWGAGKDLLADLGALVQIETDGKPPGVILSPELRRMVYEKTKLIVESSQLAFLREQQAVYAARIEDAKDWVSANFDTDSERVNQWLAQLAVLAAVAPQTELPDISASLAALREVTGARARAGAQ